MVGIATERGEPRKRKISVTISTASISVETTSSMELVTNLVESWTIEPVQPRWQVGLNGGRSRMRPTTSRRLAVGVTLNADIDGIIAVETDTRFVIVRAKRDVGDIFEADNRAVLFTHDHLAEFGVKAAQVGGGVEVDLNYLAWCCQGRRYSCSRKSRLSMTSVAVRL